MAKGTRRQVIPHSDGWAVRKPGSSRSSSVTRTQTEAIARAKEILEKTGGGELTIHRRDGTIRESDTISPGSDPRPPKGEDSRTSAA